MKKFILLYLLSFQFALAQNLNNLSFGTDSTLEIVSWNIEWFPKNGNITANYVETILTNLQADVYALQEIDDSTMLKAVVSNIPGYECYFESSYYGGLAFVYNTNTISINAKYEIYTAQPYWNPFPRAPKVLDFQFMGENYIVINNHLKCCGDGILNLNDSNDEEYRRWEAVNLLKQYIDTNLTNKKVMVVGDWNDELTDNSSNNVFNPFLNNNSDFLFTDMLIAQGPSTEWSYPTWPSHLDHILITNALFGLFTTPSEIRTLKIDNYMNSWNQYETNISDHRPMGLKLFVGNMTKIEEIKSKKQLLQTTDLLGRKTAPKAEGILLHIFSDGTVEKIIKME